MIKATYSDKINSHYWLLTSYELYNTLDKTIEKIKLANLKLKFITILYLTTKPLLFIMELYKVVPESLRGPVRKYPSIMWRGIFVMKEFKTINEQIQILLEKDLIIKNTDKAKKYLLTQNYYNLINGYGKFFPRSNKKYIDNTNFDEIAHLYVYEREIKHAIFRATLDMETHFKAIFVHRFGELYKDLDAPYLNTHCYTQENLAQVKKTILKLSQIISKYQKEKHTSIHHYISRNESVPIWVLANYIEFGTLRSMCSTAPTKLQNIVAKDLSTFIHEHIQLPYTFPPETMLSFINNINSLRNICAHNNRLIDYQCKSDSKYWAPLHKKYNNMPNDKRSSVYWVILSLQCFLSKAEYGRLHNTLLKQTNRLDRQLQSINANDILKRLGFPPDWHKTTKKIDYS